MLKPFHLTCVDFEEVNDSTEFEKKFRDSVRCKNEGRHNDCDKCQAKRFAMSAPRSYAGKKNYTSPFG